MVVQEFKPLTIEAIVRGYIIGSGWKDYQQTGSRLRHRAAGGPARSARSCRRRSSRPRPRRRSGQHDENISFAEAEQARRRRAGAPGARRVDLASTREAAEYAATRGIIIADTKFEFGTDAAGKLYLIDEILTPDSSRFWPADAIQGRHQPALVRQAVRARLAGDAALEQEGARRRACRPRSSPRPPRSTAKRCAC